MGNYIYTYLHNIQMDGQTFEPVLLGHHAEEMMTQNQLTQEESEENLRKSQEHKSSPAGTNSL